MIVIARMMMNWRIWLNIFVVSFGLSSVCFGEVQQSALANKLDTWRTLKEGGGAFEDYEKFVHENPHWPDTGSIVQLAEQALIKEKVPSNRVLRWFSKHKPRTEEGLFFYTHTLGETGSEQKLSIIRQAWRERISVKKEGDFYKKWGKHLRTADHTERQYLLMLKGSSSPLALAKGAQLLPGTAVYQEIKRLLKEKKYEAAYKVFQPKAKLLAKEFKEKNQEEYFWKLLNAIARERLEIQDYAEALKIVTQHNLPKSSEEWINAEWFKGWMCWKVGKFQQAYSTFQNLYKLVGSPISLARMAFWAAESARSLKKYEEATAWHKKSATYGMTYYGQLSAQKLGETYKISFWPEESAAEPPSNIHFEKDEIYQVLSGDYNLTLAEQKKFFQLWIKKLQQHHKDGRSAIFSYAVELAYQKGGSPLAVMVMRFVNFHSPMFSRKAFPMLEGVDSDIKPLACAITWRESGFDPDITSPAGAVGMMQVMLYTFKEEQKKMGMGETDLVITNPKDNVRVGSFLIKRLMQKYGHVFLALTAYNAGEKATDRWVSVFGCPPSLDDDPIKIANWIESIPYYETRNYVPRVMEKMNVYRTIID